MTVGAQDSTCEILHVYRLRGSNCYVSVSSLSNAEQIKKKRSKERRAYAYSGTHTQTSDATSRGARAPACATEAGVVLAAAPRFDNNLLADDAIGEA